MSSDLWLRIRSGRGHGDRYIVKKILPCHHAIPMATGEPAATPDGPGCTSCGRVRWCTQCEKVARAVFQNPHVGLQAEYFLACLTTVLARMALMLLRIRRLMLHHPNQWHQEIAQLCLSVL